jgi:hypothetical protein
VTLTLILIVVIAAGVGAFVAVRMQRRPASEQRREDPFATTVVAPVEHELRRLRVGDVVGHEHHELVVRGTLRFDEDGSLWAEHLLDDAKGTKRWLSVEDDEGLECFLWRRLEGSGLSPDGDEVVHDGTTYRLDERGTAHYQADGTTGTPAAGDAEYAEYVAASSRLAFERFGGTDWEVSVGEPVLPSSLRVWNAAG